MTRARRAVLVLELHAVSLFSKKRCFPRVVSPQPQAALPAADTDTRRSNPGFCPRRSRYDHDKHQKIATHSAPHLSSRRYTSLSLSVRRSRLLRSRTRRSHRSPIRTHTSSCRFTRPVGTCAPVTSCRAGPRSCATDRAASPAPSQPASSCEGRRRRGHPRARSPPTSPPHRPRQTAPWSSPSRS